jgi:hypothetical protein
MGISGRLLRLCILLVLPFCDGTGSHFHMWWMRLTLAVFQRCPSIPKRSELLHSELLISPR